MGLDAGTLRNWLQARGPVALAELQRRAERLELTARAPDVMPMTAADYSRAVPDDPDRPCCGYCGMTSERVALTDPDPSFAGEQFCTYEAGCIARRRLRYPDIEYPWAAEVRSRAEAATRDLEQIQLAVAAWGDFDLPVLELRLSKSAVLATEQARRARRADRPRTAPAPRPVPAASPAPPRPVMVPRRPAMRPVARGRLGEHVAWVPAQPEPGQHRP